MFASSNINDEEKNKYEIVFTDEIYSSIHYDSDFYLHNHQYSELNSELYGILREYVNENIDSFLGYVFYNSYGLAVVTFLDKKPDTCIEHFKKNSVSMEINCASFAVLLALLSIRKGNSKIVEVFIGCLRKELAEMEKSIGWNGLIENLQKLIDSHPKQNLSFLPVGLQWTLDEYERLSNKDLSTGYFLGKYSIENVTIKVIEHILRTANTVEEQLEAYKLIDANVKNISEKKRINLPVAWYNKIERGYFGNYLTLGATYCRVEKVPTEEEYEKLIKISEPACVDELPINNKDLIGQIIGGIQNTPAKNTNIQKKKKAKNSKSKVHPPKTLKYFKHGNNGILMKQRKRVTIIFQKFNEWGWLNDETTPDDFDAFFDGVPRHCNIKWTGTSTTLTILLHDLLLQGCIGAQSKCTATSLVKEQFGKTPNFDRNRLNQEEEFRIKITLFILDIKNPLPQKRGRGYIEEECDIQDAAYREILTGQLHSTKSV